MSQQQCSNFQKLYLELINTSGDDPYIFKKIRQSSITFVYKFFPDSEFKLAENREYQNCPDIDTEQKHPIVINISQVLLIQMSRKLRKLSTMFL